MPQGGSGGGTSCCNPLPRLDVECRSTVALPLPVQLTVHRLSRRERFFFFVETAEKAVTMTLLFYGSYSSKPCLAANWPLLECSCYLQNQR